MRLKVVARERRLLRKISPWNALAKRDESASDLTKVTRYRPELFGKPFRDAEKRAMRGPTPRTEGASQQQPSRRRSACSETQRHGASARRPFARAWGSGWTRHRAGARGC